MSSQTCQDSNVLLQLRRWNFFHSIWHDGVLYKIQSFPAYVLWRILYKWYYNVTAVIKWNGRVHNIVPVNVSRATRKGSLLSLLLFNIHLSDLLHELDGVNQGLRVGTHLYNSFAYADDVSICFPYCTRFTIAH